MDLGNNEKFQELAEVLKNRLEKREIEIDDDEIIQELNFALLEYYNDRHFNPTDNEPFEDIYAGIIVQLALSAIMKKGAEGEKAHSEGGVGRTYDSASDYPLGLTRKIIPLAKGVGK